MRKIVTYSLICVFVFFVRAKKRKQKIENKKFKEREKSPQGNVLNTDVPTARLMY